MDAIDFLKKQHDQIDSLFSDLEEAGNEEEMTSLFAELADNFMIHSHLEEEIFYPTVFEDKTEEELREAVEEHLLAKRIIADMLEMSPSDEQWEAKCSVLKEVIEHHVEEEEDELFPLVRRLFTKKRMSDLGSRLLERYEELEAEEEPRMLVFEETDEAVVPSPA